VLPKARQKRPKRATPRVAKQQAAKDGSRAKSRTAPRSQTGQQARAISKPNAPTQPPSRPEPWVWQAETNLLGRLEATGLLAAPGNTEKVLETVVQNLEITNSMDISPAVHCRVITTTPLETTNLAHTILVSRGLIDVLPDEASLAMVLAHELAHINLGHRLLALQHPPTRLKDQEKLWRDGLTHDPRTEAAADEFATSLLLHSPYAGHLGNAGLFLRALQLRGPHVPNLAKLHLGDSWLDRGRVRMSQLMAYAPPLDPGKITQIAALPLGSRTELNPWTNRVQLVKMHQTPVVSAADKMPFEVTPLRPSFTLTGWTGKPAPRAGR
jgi:hypothetical protein